MINGHFQTSTSFRGRTPILQAVLLALTTIQQSNLNYLKEVVKPFSTFEDFYNRYTNAPTVKISLVLDGGDDANKVLNFEVGKTEKRTKALTNSVYPRYEEGLFYLFANRTGPQEISELNREHRIGQNGQHALGWFELNKDKPVSKELIVAEAPAKTLKSQLA